MWTPIAGAALCLIVFAVYRETMGTTVPFWDAGEFISTSYILGIPHPPGTPLYVLLGRLATLLPFGTIAGRVNGLSALGATVAALFTFLATSKLVQAMWARERDVPWVLPLAAGLVAGASVAFSETFWINAIEAEVYGISSMVMAISIWAVLRWRELPDREHRVGWLLVVFYILSLSIGVHLGTYLVLPGLVVLVLAEWVRTPRERAVLRAVIVGAMVVVPVLAMAVAVGWLRTPGFEALMRWLVRAVPVLLAVAACAIVLVKHPRLALALMALFVLGVSVHFYLLIRAGVDPPPAINEADPSNWRALWDVLLRKQYPPSDIFVRRAPLTFQFGRLYGHYLRQQFLLGPLWMLPLALGMLGAAAQAVWKRRDAAMMLTHFWVMCVLLVIYLNLSGHLDTASGRWVIGEVRERDYFFSPSFQIFGMWIGIGAATVALMLWQLASGRAGKRALAGGGVIVALLLAVPIGHAFQQRFEAHDRTYNLVARDYGYNILNFLEPDALLFTNGDNDTFPLWYLQEVEGVRKDVRVICLSLLNTQWYIRQCRDQEPQVPMTRLQDDALLDDLQVVLEARSNKVYVVDKRRPGPEGVVGPGTVKDVAVRDIIAANHFQRPVYFAVTVPDRVGQDRLLSFEGMVFRVLPEPPPRPVDFDRLYENAFENYEFAGLLRDDFSRDPRVVVDETGEYLVQNYVNMFTQLAYELNARGRYQEALKMVRAARAINPTYVQLDLLEGMLFDALGRHDGAAAIFQRLIDAGRGVLDAYYRLGITHYHAGQLEPAVAAMEQAVGRAEGGFFEPTLWLARFQWDRGHPEVARQLIGAWVEAHAADENARRILDRLSSGDDTLLPR